VLFTTLEASLLSLVLLAVIFVPLERLFPARTQRVLRAHLGTDFLFLFGQHLVWSVLALAVLSSLDLHVRGAVEVLAGLPRWVQVVVVLLLGDALVYWFHRACHRFEFLWRFHAVHHSSETLDWVAAHREHPLDGLLTQVTLNLPAMLLGFPVEGLAAIAVVRGLWATFIHSNVKLPLGPLRYLLGAPDLHHWHHAKHPGRVANFGNLSPWTDLVFGTFHRPHSDETWELGVPESLPKSWPGLLVSPFLPAWNASASLFRARVLGPVALAVLVTVTFGGLATFAQSVDAGASDAGVDAGSLRDLFGSGDYLPATKAFGPSTMQGGFGGLGLRGSGTGGAGIGGLGRTLSIDVSVVGPLKVEAVKLVLKSHTPQLAACLSTDGGAAGVVVIKFAVEKSGAVGGEPTFIRGDSACLLALVKTLQFQPKSAPSLVTASFGP
jgi:sterol desaturase/sphingolipid hydroxylase (fatty acid hydroxylase superfamily)